MAKFTAVFKAEFTKGIIHSAVLLGQNSQQDSHQTSQQDSCRAETQKDSLRAEFIAGFT